MTEKGDFLREYSEFLDTTGQHLTYAAISTYLNFTRDLSEKERNFLKGHLDTCPGCSSRMREVEEMEKDQARVRFEWWTTPIPFRFAIAAAIVAVLGGAIFLYMTFKLGGQTDASRVKSLAVQSPNPERFAQNPMLENFVARTVRSASASTFKTPANGDTLSVPYIFRWTAQKNSHAYVLSIVDNKNVESWRGKTGLLELKVEKKLQPGLYYAKLEVDGDLVTAARFVVLR